MNVIHGVVETNNTRQHTIRFGPVPPCAPCELSLCPAAANRARRLCSMTEDTRKNLPHQHHAVFEGVVRPRVSRGCSSEKHSSSVVAAVCCKRCTLPCTFNSTCLIRRNRTATTRIAPPTTAVPVVSHSHAEKRSVYIPIIYTLICPL